MLKEPIRVRRLLFPLPPLPSFSPADPRRRSTHQIRPWKSGRQHGLKLVGLGPDGVEEAAEDDVSGQRGWWPFGGWGGKGKEEEGEGEGEGEKE